MGDNERLDILPVSVIDIEAQKKRLNENHSSTSSRKNFSPFPKEINMLCHELFLRDKTKIVDPFAGWGERHDMANKFGKHYVGFDTSEKAISEAKINYGVDNILADSMYVDIPEFDGLITCPPYWNLEKYESDNGIDRKKNWKDFLRDLEVIFHRFYEKAEPNSVFCVMVGDWRKNHVYYDFDYQVASMFSKFGATTVDKVVVSRKKVSKIKIMLPQAKRLGYTVRVHENLLVFKKENKN